MDSHEEKVYQAVRQTQEREAKQKMREKAKELQRQRMESIKRGLPMGGRNYGSGGGSSDGFGSMGGGGGGSSMSSPSISMPDIKPSPTMPYVFLIGKIKMLFC